MTGVVVASAPITGTVRLERNGRVLVKGPFEFHTGPNLLPFRDLVDEPGLAAYRLKVEVPGDGVVENDVGQAVLRVEGPPRVLLLTGQPEGTLSKALRSAGLTLEVRAPFPPDARCARRRGHGGLRAALEGMVRWSMGGAGEAVARSERRGNLLRVTLDFAPGEALPGALPSLVLLAALLGGFLPHAAHGGEMRSSPVRRVLDAPGPPSLLFTCFPGRGQVMLRAFQCSGRSQCREG